MDFNKQIASAILLSCLASGASAGLIIDRSYTASSGCGEADCGTSGGLVTFEDTGTNQLFITIDNTSVAAIGSVDDGNSAVITGIVFDILTDIGAASVTSFTDGNSVAITGWVLELNVDNSITPNNTVVDMSFTLTNGINGGIYNSADPGSNTSNVLPDLVNITIDISKPSPWSLQQDGISGDWLRMQRVGLNGGSLKIPGVPGGGVNPPEEVPTPGTVLLLGLGMAGLGFSRNKRRGS
jgi:hypothetical protein